jgi:phosphatidylglycerol:prolipoprotein diacylglycerol transferase
MNFDNLGIKVGPVTFSYFGLLLIAAMIITGYVTHRAARRKGESPEPILDILTWALILGIVLARLFYVWNPPPSVSQFYDRRWYLTHPFDLQIGPLAVWSGGLGMAGALLGGVLGAAIILWRRKLDMRLWADLLTPGLLLGLAVAAWANIATHQMIGPPTNLPWGVRVILPPAPYDDFARYPADATRFHPTPAYLSLWALLTLGITLFARHRFTARLRRGDTFLLASAIYLPGLFLADFLRVDVNHGLLTLTGMQTLTLLALLPIIWLAVHRPESTPQPQPPGANSRAAPDTHKE